MNTSRGVNVSGRPVNVCIPVLKRYDLLRELLLSLKTSTVMPSKICIIDNGRDDARLKMALSVTGILTDVFTPSVSMGVAESWNWFLENVSEERLIVNDDIIFASDSIEKMLAPDVDLVWAEGCGFSCYVIRDACVEKLGLFDESISPGYGYYEDEDYLQRLDGRGTREPSATAVNVDSGVVHHHSATLKAATHEELLDHHRKFLIAQGNYVKKWHLEETFR